MLVIKASECKTRHQVLKEVLGYQANTVRKLLMDAERRQNEKYTLHHWPNSDADMIQHFRDELQQGGDGEQTLV